MSEHRQTAGSHSLSSTFMQMYRLMLDHRGPQNWWPADTELEVMIGAVLTQNTNWGNVEKAIRELRRHGMLSVAALAEAEASELARLIRPAGYFNVKAARLKNLVYFIRDRYGGDLQEMLEEETENLRRSLLSINGIGPETADSILLYAAGRPVFVIDAYTRRILARHGICSPRAGYEEVQNLLSSNLPASPELFNEFHALIVAVGKHYCRKQPRCELCPLKDWGNVS